MSNQRKKILVLCPSPVGTNPGQRLKYEQYFSHWEENGFDITVSPFQSLRFWNIIYKKGHFFEKVFWVFVGYFHRFLDLFRIPFYDVVYVTMSVTPLGPPIFERLLFLLNKNVISDIEDMAFLPNASDANKFIKHLKGTSKYKYLMKHAKHVIVSTPSLGDEVRKYNQNVTDIVATFNTKRFLPVPDYTKKETTVIGWTGSHSTLQYLHLLDNVFKRLSKLRKIKVLVICNAVYDCEGVEVENVQWTEANEVSDLHRIDIGVYPVPFDKWVLGKSGCKTITYMTCAIPSVSTEYGNVVTQVVDKNVNGLLVKTEDEWIEALCKLIDDVNLRREIGIKAREKVESHFSIEATKQKYLAILNEVIY